MSIFSRVPAAYRTVFLVSFAVAMLFAVFTNHIWEDYYITYRASKNLATGQGLVFNHGDRLHTFTSPLGVLLPALASVLTLNQSDTVALWLFRLMSIASLAGAATLIYALVFHLYRNVALAALAAAWLALDAKSLDFTVNGMETGLLLLFVSWTLWCQFGACSRRWLWLGLAWAGLMWTRPDSFLYVGLLALGTLLFNDRSRSGLSRFDWLKVFLLAGLVCTAAYLPWFIGSWIYYGTPIPHTIAAKAGVVTTSKTVVGALQFALTLPAQLWKGDGALFDAYLPSYHMMGGWPALFSPFAKLLSFVAAFAWLAPFVDRTARAASLAFFGLHVYLGYYPYFPFPWYLPGTALVGYFVIAGVLGGMITRSARLGSAPAVSTSGRWTMLALGAASLIVVFNLWSSTASARQLAAQQRWIEDGNRRKIGEWLREQASPGDRVFLEPLGYIGYFSGLKTYDFPGMSSREMVDAIRHVGTDWARLIDFLGPEWVVLRPIEVERVNRSFPHLLTTTYRQVKEFSVLPEVQELSVSGRPYLEFDARFRVFRRERPNRLVSDLGEFHTPFGLSVVTIDQRQLQLVHAPSTWIVALPPGARHVHIAFGYPPAAYQGDLKTDGAVFAVKVVDGPREHILLARTLDPANRPEDRTLQSIDLDLPSYSERAQLHLVASPGVNTTNDWTSWVRPEFR